MANEQDDTANQVQDAAQAGAEAAADAAGGATGAATDEQGTEQAGAEDAQEASEPDEVNDLPDWAKRERKSLRDEAARYRTTLREVERQLEEAQQRGENVAQMQATIKQMEGELARERALRLHPLPESLQSFVTADTEEEAIAQAKALADNLNAAPHAPAVDIGGGRNPQSQGGREDPRAAAAQRYRRI